MVTTFLIGELWRLPDSLLVLFEVLLEDGRDEVLLSVGVGVGVSLAVLGALGFWLATCLLLSCGFTGSTTD